MSIETQKEYGDDYASDEQAEEIAEQIAPLIKRIRPGILPPQLFLALREHIIWSTLEVAGFEAGTDGGRVLIAQRGYDRGDQHFQGKLNLPGSVILPTDELEPEQWSMDDGSPVDVGRAIIGRDFTTIADRILRKELDESVVRVDDVRAYEFMHQPRWGNARNENKTNVWTEVKLADGAEGVLNGDFYDTQEVIHHPPENLVFGHQYIVQQALRSYRAAQWDL